MLQEIVRKKRIVLSPFSPMDRPNNPYQPLAERMRPTTLEEYVGQRHIVAETAPLGRMIRSGKVPSLILWGPPGVGKTTLAELIAHSVEAPFYKLSAVGSGVGDVRRVLEEAERSTQGFFAAKSRPLLFIDEIHRFSKSQQDSLLAAVERGIVTLIGATTENPSFEVIRPLLSRCQVFVLQSLEPEDLRQLLKRAISTDIYLVPRKVKIESDKQLLAYAGGDARKLLNLLEILAGATSATPLVITDELVRESMMRQPMVFDKGGEMHYDIASAFIKSIRGSDPDAALYWMARLIEGGENPRFVARRIVISAAEDIGLANPNALIIANAAAQAVELIGWPEGRIPLAEAVVYLAASPKSNSAYLAIDSALAYVRNSGNLPVPLHLRNAPTQLMGDLGYGVDYKYPHDYDKHYVPQEYLPSEARGQHFYTPQVTGAAERRLVEYLEFIHEEKKESDKNIQKQ